MVVPVPLEPEASADLGARERPLRNNVGVAGALLTVLTFAALIETHAPPLWRLLVILPAAVTALRFLQARARYATATQLAAQTRKVWAESALAVTVLTLLALAIP